MGVVPVPVPVPVVTTAWGGLLSSSITGSDGTLDEGGGVSSPCQVICDLHPEELGASH